MNQQHQSRGPLIFAIALFLLPLLYAGSNFVLVLPQGKLVSKPVIGSRFPGLFTTYRTHYRWGHELPTTIFWPLEQMDRNLRSSAWRRNPRTVNEFLAQPRPSP